MANKLYPKCDQALLTAGVNLVSGIVKAQLVDTSTYTYSDTHQFPSDVSAAAHYGTAATLANKTVVNGLFDADDALFTSVPAGSSGSTDKFGPGNDTGVTMTNTLTLPVNGLALRFAINDIDNTNSGPATLTNDDGGTTIATGNFTNFDDGQTLSTVATLPAIASPSVVFAGSASYIRLTGIAFGPA
ncbi:hypothetical protein D9601_12815 [Sphingomonas sp. MA1305]|uniref:hypothetical protein n=1 Tax=Sphingomonas sp. MA1305 TaxID=2479204 RepID=UPI0018DFA3C3|nr:hypothetical protein [Sphingomonas sp. MA1305]MBI0476229.1 hypothetical protein [Sphingomonas sp. MA1305]